MKVAVVGDGIVGFTVARLLAQAFAEWRISVFGDATDDTGKSLVINQGTADVLASLSALPANTRPISQAQISFANSPAGGVLTDSNNFYYAIDRSAVITALRAGGGDNIQHTAARITDIKHSDDTVTITHTDADHTQQHSDCNLLIITCPLPNLPPPFITRRHSYHQTILSFITRPTGGDTTTDNTNTVTTDSNTTATIDTVTNTAADTAADTIAAESNSDTTAADTNINTADADATAADTTTTAQQKFFAHGIAVMVPRTDSNIGTVLCLNPAHAHHYTTMPDAQLAATVSALFATPLTISGKRHIYCPTLVRTTPIATAPFATTTAANSIVTTTPAATANNPIAATSPVATAANPTATPVATVTAPAPTAANPIAAAAPIAMAPIALVGQGATTLHPVGAQALRLAFGDAIALRDSLAESTGTTTAIRHYARRRLIAHRTAAAVTTALALPAYCNPLPLRFAGGFAAAVLTRPPFAAKLLTHLKKLA